MGARAGIAVLALVVCAMAPADAWSAQHGTDARSLLMKNKKGKNQNPKLKGVEDFREWMVEAGAEGRAEIFKDAKPGPSPNGTYQAFLYSDTPNVDEFGLNGAQKAVLSFVIAQFLGKTFSGDGQVTNVLANNGAFDPKALAGVDELAPGFLDGKDSWVTRFPDTINDFIVDEFREVQDGFLMGRTYFGPEVELGDPTLFECGLVRLVYELPEGMTAAEVILEARS
eukprot:evm.model.scf_2929.2 EVM.evm.TU.scf_2929.2   scf_2929:5773-8056(+)